MIKITIKFTALDEFHKFTNRIYTEEAWWRAVTKIEDQLIPIKIDGSDSLSIGHVKLVDYTWPTITFEGSFADYQFDVVKNGEPTFCGIGLCDYVMEKQVNYVRSFTLDSIIITSKSDTKFEWTIQPESNIRCCRCKNFMETFNYFVKYKGNSYCENCFFDVAIEALGAEQWKTDSQGNEYKLYEDEVDE